MLDKGSAPGVGSWIERRARIRPDAPALVVDDRPVSYAEFAERIRRVAIAFRGLGVGHGNRVGWIGPSHSAFLESFFAAGLLGAALAPINHRLPADEGRPRLGVEVDSCVVPEG